MHIHVHVHMNNIISQMSSFDSNLAFLITATVLFIQACKTPSSLGNEGPPPTIRIDSTQWVPVTMQIGNTHYTFGDEYPLTFEGGSAGIKLDENSCGAAYTYKKNTLKFDETFMCTQICCDLILNF